MEAHENVNTQNKTTEIPNSDRIKADATEVMENAKTAGRQQFESGKQTAVSQADKVADVIERASSELREKNLQTLADYTSELGSAIKNFSDGLQNRTVDDLVTDIRDIARRNPTAFILGSVVIGIGISRFFKASAERREHSSLRAADMNDRPSCGVEQPYVGEGEYE
jgi:hypothetical protein